MSERDIRTNTWRPPVFDLPYDVLEVPVADGRLSVGRWGSGPRTVLAAHGVTANHASFHALADALGPEITLLAPDLRGRAGSREVGPPFGMPAHAADVAAILREHAEGPAVLVGHSMGGFVAAVTAAQHAELVSHVVLVDGGLPLDLGPLASLPMEELLKAVLGPSIERLAMTFPSAEAYFDYWRPHPALVKDWGPYLERYLAADLMPAEDGLRPSARLEAVVADSESDLRDNVVEHALAQIPQPLVHLRAPRGVMDQEPPLYPEASLERWRDMIPQLETRLVDDVNHFTILLSERGARQVAEVVHHALASRTT